MEPRIQAIGEGLRAYLFEGVEVRLYPLADGEFELCAADVARALGHSDPSKMTESLEPDEKGPRDVRTPGGNQRLTFITKPGLYRLLSLSRKPEAKRFQRWLFHEVVPAIERTGSYSVAAQPSAALDVRTMAQLARSVLALTEQVEQKDQQIAEMAPRAVAWDSVGEGHGERNIRNTCKALGIKESVFYRWAKGDEILYRGGDGKWVPYAQYGHAGGAWFRVIPHPALNGETRLQTVVTDKGVWALGQRLVKAGLIGRLPDALPAPDHVPLPAAHLPAQHALPEARP